MMTYPNATPVVADPDAVIVVVRTIVVAPR